MISQQFLKLFIQEMGTYISQREYYMSPVTESPTKLSTTFLLFNTIKELVCYQYTSINTKNSIVLLTSIETWRKTIILQKKKRGMYLSEEFKVSP